MNPEKQKLISTIRLIDEYSLAVVEHMKKGDHTKFMTLFEFLRDEMEKFEAKQIEKEAKEMAENDKFDLNEEGE